MGRYSPEARTAVRLIIRTMRPAGQRRWTGRMDRMGRIPGTGLCQMECRDKEMSRQAAQDTGIWPDRPASLHSRDIISLSIVARRISSREVLQQQEITEEPAIM